MLLPQIIALLCAAFAPDEADGYQREVLVSIPRGIELTINNRYSFTSNRENYLTRARKLIFNLKKNKVTPPPPCSFLFRRVTIVCRTSG
jgi:hypothetical protein